MKNIGEQAKAFRESKGWNTTKMAKEVGTSRQSIENLEAKGNRKPHYIIGLARVMGVTVDALLKGAGEPSQADAKVTGSAAPAAPMPLFPPINQVPALSPNAMMLAQWLDDMPDDRIKFMTFTECMALITRRLGSAESTEGRDPLDGEETSSDESHAGQAERRTPKTGNTGRRHA